MAACHYVGAVAITSSVEGITSGVEGIPTSVEGTFSTEEDNANSAATIFTMISKLEFRNSKYEMMVARFELHVSHHALCLESITADFWRCCHGLTAVAHIPTTAALGPVVTRAAVVLSVALLPEHPVRSFSIYLLNIRHAQSPLIFCAVSVRPKVAALSQSMAASEG